jgi:drug/metabolite transporter (DMT)-like permease
LEALRLEPAGRISGAAGGVFSGFAFALYGVLAGRAMELPPLAAAGFPAAPLAAAALNDSLSALWVFLANRRRAPGNTWKAVYTTKPGRLVILGGFLGGPLAGVLFLAAVKSAPAAYVLPVSALCPLFGCLFARLFLGQRISPKTALGMAVCVLGTVLTALSGGPERAGLPAPFFCALGAAALWALDGVCSAYAMRTMPPGAALQIRQCVSGFVLLALVMPLLRSWPLLVKTAAAPLPAFYLFSASLFTALSYLHWYRANRLLGVAAGMSLNTTYVFWGAALSALLSRQMPGAGNILGMAAVITGVRIITLGQKEGSGPASKPGRSGESPGTGPGVNGG